MRLSRNNDIGKVGFSHKFVIKHITCPITDCFESSNEIKYEKKNPGQQSYETVVASRKVGREFNVRCICPTYEF